MSKPSKKSLAPKGRGRQRTQRSGRKRPSQRTLLDTLVRRKGTRIRLRVVSHEPGKDEVRCWVSRREDTEGGYNEYEVRMAQHRNGSLVFSEESGGRDGFIYFYPEQVKHLKTFLGLSRARKGGGEGATPEGRRRGATDE